MKKNNIEILKDLLDTVDTHFERVDYVGRSLQHLFPMTVEQIENITEDDRVKCDALLYRFTHLQDTMAGKVLSLWLEITAEQTQSLSFIDKLNLLERREIIESAYQWQNLRDLRNKLSHEYDDKPERQAELLNHVWQSFPMIRVCVERIKQRIALLPL